ncbi:MAG: HAMP domain-containing protein [Chlorogloeopsis fritschii C42_A2020_084]|uniref:methyl-accepting chemotaxis protein n=1 Tax=Chlorogloeopsis fritschii TaxID=1124 RepID=UPI0019D96E1B|nr:methyl-accepting chemotaxis protein [Chlorogloeopsis fritschii]MBF2007833.1 HAMP domain-containing protein [Chlorogloeopsis fritschii C42_A2020_084]
MAASVDDYAQTYQQALTAYAQQNYEEAATLIDEVVQNLPQDPNTHLLRGHIYYVLQKFDVAKAEYQEVLKLTEDSEIVGFAKNGLEHIEQFQQELDAFAEVDSNSKADLLELSNYGEDGQQELEDLAAIADSSDEKFDFSSFEQQDVLEMPQEDSLDSNPFDIPVDISLFDTELESSEKSDENPFAFSSEEAEDSQVNIWNKQTELKFPAFLEEDIEDISVESEKEAEGLSNFFTDSIDSVSEDSEFNQHNNGDSSSFAPDDSFSIPELEQENKRNFSTFEPENSFSIPELENQENLAEQTSPKQVEPNSKLMFNRFEDETLLVQESGISGDFSGINSLGYSSPEKFSSTNSNSTFNIESQKHNSTHINSSSSFEDNDSFDIEAFESAFGSENFTDSEDTNSILNAKASQGSNIEFLDDFDDFDDLGNIQAEFDFVADSNLGDSQLHSGAIALDSKNQSRALETNKSSQKNQAAGGNTDKDRDDELFSITGSQEAVPIFTQSSAANIEPQVNVEQGLLAPFENAPLTTKQWIIGGTAGIVSAVVVAAVSFTATTISPPQQRASLRNTGWAMALAAGIASFATAGVMGNLGIKKLRRTTKDLQAQFDAVRQGNLNVKATVYSQDELGQLAAGFNEMTRVIFTTTHEATRKAQEQEEAKENLQRQVIRLLDDVEGAARGDLTVQAEVTADVLGAVADAFNLTIQNLRDIVQQVKVAAREVTKGATNSETFARALSSDALRQAEELAVTLNSVQVMTDSIQRVAEAAREAEAVARDASSIALKGGEAVENTVAGILEIRETVAETTRKVKRLAESSQEISKIVALISQIASRTNLLALNASIEAARAGEAGRGFAIVADEVRQLADRSAKSLKEIEEIVRQIQSETSSVMTAMEEGTQQVIQGTILAEEAKRSLENIIQVANRIDILVRSITTDTVEQTETSRAVAQVMQSVELTAQETSQEAQRVSGALQNLVGVSRDLISSVERFRVEASETR